MAFDPGNDFERSLMKAATDVAHRPQFYRDFVSANLYVIEEGPAAGGSGPRMLATGEKLALRTWQKDGKTVIPVFSSVQRLQGYVKEEVRYLGMKATDFMEMTRGAALLLNPGADYGKEFTVGEIASILDGSIWKPMESWAASKPTNVLIAQPKNYPTELAKVLSRYFEMMPQVRRAFLALVMNPERSDKANIVVAIEVSSDWEKVVSGAGLISRDVKVADAPVDFMQYTGTGGIGGYFAGGVKPFYEKKKKFLGIF